MSWRGWGPVTRGGGGSLGGVHLEPAQLPTCPLPIQEAWEVMLSSIPEGSPFSPPS